MVKKTVFSRVRSTSENANIFTARDKYIWYLPKNLFLLYSPLIQKAQPYFFPGRFPFSFTFSVCLLVYLYKLGLILPNQISKLVCLSLPSVISVYFSLVVTSLEKAGLLALLCMMFSCAFVTFLYGVLGQVGHLILSISDLCLLLLCDL